MVTTALIFVQSWVAVACRWGITQVQHIVMRKYQTCASDHALPLPTLFSDQQYLSCCHSLLSFRLCLVDRFVHFLLFPTNFKCLFSLIWCRFKFLLNFCMHRFYLKLEVEIQLQSRWQKFWGTKELNFDLCLQKFTRCEYHSMKALSLCLFLFEWMYIYIYI